MEDELDIEEERVRRKVRASLVGEPASPMTVGGFELHGWLGAGAMGNVYEAYDPKLDRTVALKVLDPELPPEMRRERRERLLREAQALARIDHPHVVRVLSVGEDLGHVFIAMERIDGDPLPVWLGRERPEPGRIVRVLSAAGRGLAAAHERGVVHRDFKPDNVLVGPGDRATVVDFGLARALEDAPDLAEDSPLLRTMTHTGASVGTPAYMAPEQLRGERGDARSDQFLFCATLYEALAGRGPFEGATPAERIAATAAGDVRDPPPERIPKAVFAILRRGLSPLPEDRYPSLAALLDALDEVASGPEVGRRIADRYLLLEQLGAGGMGVVYRARDEAGGREVAIKLLSARRLEEPRARDRLREEARAAAAIDHPNVVRVHDAGETEDDGAYVVMECVTGQTLRERLRGGPLPRDEAADVIAQVAAGLAAAHEAGLVHRDVKPDNVMLSDDGRVVLLDLGVVKWTERDAIEGSTLTAEGALVGTTPYLSPEQVRGHEVTPASDQFSLAVMAHELLGGRRPWRGDPAAVLAQIVADDPPALGDPVDPVLARALSKRPADRYPGVVDFAGALGRALTGGDRPADRGRVLRWTTMALGAGVVGSLLFVAFGNGSEQPATPLAVNPLSSADSIVACPILDTPGEREPNGWLGAAAADLACRRITWALGGDERRTRVPAELLGLPRQPADDFPALPYDAPDARARSRERAREVADVVLSGSLRRDGRLFDVTLELRTPEGSRSLGRAQARASVLITAVNEAIAALESDGSIPRAPRLVPEVARWMLTEDPEVGILVDAITYTPGLHADRTRWCEDLFARGEELGAPVIRARQQCAHAQPERFEVEHATRLSRESPPHLVASVAALAPDIPIDGLADEVGAVRAAADDPRARAELAYAEGLLSKRDGDSMAARSTLVAAVLHLPRSLDLREAIVSATVGNTRPTGATRAVAAWCPAAGLAQTRMAWWGELVDPEAQLEQHRRAGTIYPHDPPLVMHYVMELLRYGRVEDARTAAAELSQAEVPHAVASAYVHALIDASAARFARAIERLRAALAEVTRLRPGYTGETSSLIAVRKLAEVTGQEREVGDWFAREIALAEPSRLPEAPGALDMPMTALCMYASPEPAAACLERIARIRDEAPAARTGSESFDAYLEGARHYAAGDVRGAADAWRNIVTDWYFASNLPVSAFDAAGEPELGDRCADPQRGRTIYHGISRVHPRDAERAAAAGDVETARRIAREVIEAWSVADRPIPAVARMEALLGRLTGS